MRLVVRQDLQSIRNLLRRIKTSVRFVGIGFSGRATPTRMTDYLGRRDSPRRRIELPIYVRPVAFDGQYAEPLEKGKNEVLAITRDASPRGVGFMHDEPLAGDYAIVSVDLLDGCPVSLLLNVLWSNVQSGFTYMSGGRFLGIAETAARQQVGRPLREMPEFDDVLMIAPTGYGQEEDRWKAKEAKFDEHLTKPLAVGQMKGLTKPHCDTQWKKRWAYQPLAAMR